MRIALIHATRLAIPPVEAAFAALWPEVRTLSIMDEGLSIDAASGQATRDDLDARIVALADYARGLSPDAILYTCSAFGTGIEEAARRHDIPVLKPNEAMFEAVLSAGKRAAMLHTFPPAAEPMEREYREEAAARGVGEDLRSILVEGAREALADGDGAAHDRLIAETAARVAEADVLMLAHFSMARSAEAVRAATSLPVLTSPETAVKKLRRLLDAGAAA